MLSQEVVVEVCPQCDYIRCPALFGNAWFQSPGVNPEIPQLEKYCPHCDRLMPMVERLALNGGLTQMSLSFSAF